MSPSCAAWFETLLLALWLGRDCITAYSCHRLDWLVSPLPLARPDFSFTLPDRCSSLWLPVLHRGTCCISCLTCLHPCLEGDRRFLGQEKADFHSLPFHCENGACFAHLARDHASCSAAPASGIRGWVAPLMRCQKHQIPYCSALSCGCKLQHCHRPCACSCPAGEGQPGPVPLRLLPRPWVDDQPASLAGPQVHSPVCMHACGA